MKRKNAVVGTKVVHKVYGSKGVVSAIGGFENIAFIDWDDGTSRPASVCNLKKAEKVK